MLQHIDKKELKKAQVYSTEKRDVKNFVRIFNMIVDVNNDHTYLTPSWIRSAMKGDEEYYYISVFGKCYKNFSEAISYFELKQDFDKPAATLTFK